MKILVTSKSFGQHNPAAIAMLERHGFEIIRSDITNPSAADIRRQIHNCDVLVVGNDPVDLSVIEAAERLKLIHMHGTGLDAIDVDAATQRNILVANVPGANKNAVAELTVLMMLALGRQLYTHINMVKTGSWKRQAGNEVSNSTVGIIGMGNIGRRVAELLSGFNVSIIAYDPFVEQAGAENQGIAFFSNCDDVFRNADWIVLSLPLTEQTMCLVNDHTLSLMKRTAYLINTARGGLVDEQALCRAVQNKQIAGAALDVFTEEPPAMDSPLRSADIMMTPHIGATSIETSALVSQNVAQNIIDIVIHKNTNIAVNAVKIQSISGGIYA
ncbi:MAG: phosphoglycerate dehydrogenase [Treponema sp.]|jgi:D-3-phosphoglycerate dehydrogenase|nr:phosphoglycerate dehydrogenase [Treponema sp.]